MVSRGSNLQFTWWRWRAMFLFFALCGPTVVRSTRMLRAQRKRRSTVWITPRLNATVFAFFRSVSALHWRTFALSTPEKMSEIGAPYGRAGDYSERLINFITQSLMCIPNFHQGNILFWLRTSRSVCRGTPLRDHVSFGWSEIRLKMIIEIL